MTITTTEIGAILAKCSGYRPDKTPQPGELVIMAWHEHFADFPHLTLADALEAVKRYHRDPQDRMIQPADSSKIAREIRRDKADRETEDERRRREDAIDAKVEGRRRAIEQFAAGFPSA
ncbi:MAG: hypothetical protein ABFC80_10105 [Coriobacteriales bacterium]